MPPDEPLRLPGDDLTDGGVERVAGGIFALADEGIVVCDATGTVRAINPAFSRIFSLNADAVVGRPLRHLRGRRHDARFYADGVRTALRKGAWRADLWCDRRDGQSFPAWVTLSALRDPGGRVSHFLVILSDVAQLSERHSHLEHMAHHDALTGLPNRMLLLSRIDNALARSRRMKHLGAVLFLDLDLFKGINDAFGHPAGDEVLREVGRRLMHRLRESDTGARYGGDEFVVLLEELKAVDDAGQVAATLIELLQLPVALPNGRLCQIGASIGIALFQGENLSAEILIARADEAMFEAKRQGRATFRYHASARAGISSDDDS
jgi:diguanylate cyclase (GGDEF)-like protein/PAS domain S-box-containing protein